MYKKMITSFIIITTSLPTLNASDIKIEEPQRVNPKHGYVLQIVEELTDVQDIIDTPDVVGFGVQLLNKRGKFKQRWLAVLVGIRHEKRLEGEPLRSVVGEERALFAIPGDNAQNGDGVIVCEDGLRAGQILSCRMLLYVPVESNCTRDFFEPDHFFLAHGLAHKK